MSKSMMTMMIGYPSPAQPRLAPLAARALESASHLLGRLAARLGTAAAPPGPMLPPVLEFYADSGAPEGALYLNGELVGTLPGVTRL